MLAAYLGPDVDGASVIAVTGGGTVSDTAGGGSATSGGARGARKPPTLGKLSRLEIETMECLRDCSGYRYFGCLYHL
jgi:hypothetical protein